MLYLMGSLLLALGITVFIVSKIAGLLHAKKPEMDRVFIASLIGGIVAFITLAALIALVKDLDPVILLGVSVFSMLLVSSLAFKVINQMTWAGAITTNIANVALILITGTVALVVNDQKISTAVELVQNAFHTNTAVVENLAAGNSDALGVIQDTQKERQMKEQAMKAAEAEAAIDEDVDPTFREVDFLPAGTVKELEAKKNKVRKAPRFYTISLGEAGSAVGSTVRVKNSKGSIITGVLKSSGSSLTIEQRVSGGVATAQISRSNIEKLEVYR